MINLIPKEEKRKMIKVFYYKLVILFLAVGSFSLLIVFISILPSYLLSAAKNNIIDTKLETQKNEPVPIPDQETLLVIKDTNKKLDLIENAEKNKFNVSEKVINAIILKKLPEIEITDISYKNEQKSNSLPGKKISIQGNAPSREILLLFRKALEDSSNFKVVDLPISNFVKGSNIQFYLSLIPS